MKREHLIDIESREDIHKLVSLFYAKIRKDKMLGYIFNNMIHNWDEHIERLTDFWETNLLFVAKFKGNPIAVHQKVDKTFNGTITQEHFGNWLNLWFETIDQLHLGEKAEIAKRRARKMSTHLYIKMYESRVQDITVCPFLTEKSKNVF
ncbi:group III truncated hemoglobin [Aquimarina sp. 2201CG5-10]|uniref:group III truncated hemoglobin n=1 Tax=Aquimarina callyspongiae TaxID=3098150 RepID=UPI002AB42E76|nr:group III truncated hemoglobin [Aquimarina sp. 2201CG5-10]MDY8138237.1 group III truncated hemoglobin [Aquimarina sp. 2201CG5-10]